MTPTLKKILKWGGIAIGVLIVILVVVSLVSGGKPKSSTSTGGLVSTKTGGNPLATTTSASPLRSDSEVIALLRSLSTIKLDSSVFSHPAFAVLEDLSIILPRVTAQGRPNPFAPLGGFIETMTASGTATGVNTNTGM